MGGLKSSIHQINQSEGEPKPAIHIFKHFPDKLGILVIMIIITIKLFNE